MLALHIGSTHIHTAGDIHQRADSSCSHTMLTGTRLSHYTGLSHLLGDENLTDGIIDLMSTCMVQVFTLQIKLTTILLAHSLGIVKWRRTTHVVTQQSSVFVLELFAFDNRQISLLQILYSLIKDLWDVGSAKLAVVAILINVIRFHINIYNVSYFLQQVAEAI